MRHPVLLGLAAAAALGATALGVRRARSDVAAHGVEAALLAEPAGGTFSEGHLDGLPEPARRYLRHAVAPGTALAAACRLEMTGTMRPAPGASPVDLTAAETIAPRTGFVWTARALMKGVPVRVRDHYFRGGGAVDVTALGIVPISISGEDADVARSSRGRLVAEAVWCPTALVHPDVPWEGAGPDRARYTVAVDGEPVTVTLHVAESGALREVTLDRWGDPDGGPFGLHPYGFAVRAERTFGTVTIPTEVEGGWGYGTDRFDPRVAAAFSITDMSPVHRQQP